MRVETVRCIPRLIVYQIKIAPRAIDVIKQEIRACAFRTIVPLCIQLRKETGIECITNACTDNVCCEQIRFRQVNPITFTRAKGEQTTALKKKFAPLRKKETKPCKVDRLLIRLYLCEIGIHSQV